MSRKFGISTGGVRSWFDRLTDREKKLVVGFLVALFVILVGGGFYFVYAKGNDRRSEIEAMQKLSSEIENLRSQYATAKSKNDALDGKLAVNRVDLLQRVRNAAPNGVTLSEISTRNPPDKEGVRKIKDRVVKEERVTLQVSFANPISIDKLTSFLSAIEGEESGGVVKVMSMSIRTNPGKPNLLDVTNVIVSTWKQG